MSVNNSLLNRRDFIKKSGTLITVPILLQYCSPGYLERISEYSENPLQLLKGSSADTPILQALTLAIWAPSPHNTQPWKFSLLNDSEMLLYVDEKRLLNATDPPARQIHIGQGTLLESMKIASAELGFRTQMTLLPDGDYKYNEIGHKPVAHIKLTKTEQNISDPLFKFLLKRKTIRTVYEGPEINQSEISEIINRVGMSHSSLRFVEATEDSNPYRNIFYKAMEIEARTFNKHDETKKWFRFSDAEIAKHQDGISLKSGGVNGIKKWIAETFFISPESWHDKSGTDTYLESFREKVDSSKGFIYLQTPNNSLRDWIKSGMDYMRLQLAITSLGLVSQPVSQVLQEYKEMDELRLEFESKTNSGNKNKIQMILRLGRSEYDYRSPRRALNDLIVV